jgi:hypothetical protein
MPDNYFIHFITYATYASYADNIYFYLFMCYF